MTIPTDASIIAPALLDAVRVGSTLVLAHRNARAESESHWRELSPGIHGIAAAGWAHGPLVWDPDAQRDGIAALSLYEHGAYLARIPADAVWDEDIARVASPIASALAGEGVWTLSFRGHAGRALLRVLRGDRELLRLPVEIRTRKLDHLTDYRTMLDDLGSVRWCAALTLDREPTTVPMEAGSREAASSWETFLVLRHLVRNGVLRDAIQAIRNHPIVRLSPERRRVPWERACHVRPEDLASSPYHTSAGLHSAMVLETTPKSSMDTPENRFALVALGAIAGAAEAIARDPTEPNLRVGADEIAAQLDVLRDGLFDGQVAARCASPPASTLLHTRRGYRELLAAWRIVQCAGLKVRWTDEPSLRAGTRDTAALYERWCTVEVARALGASDEAICTVLDGHSIALARVNGMAVTMAVQQNFPRGNGSYSMAFRPDIVLESCGRRLLLDAKFQIERAADLWAGANNDPAGAPRAAIAKMHAYRDAITGAWAAIVLYPGADGVVSNFEAPGGGGVGAIALRPCSRDGVRRTQREAVASLVHRMVSSPRVARPGQGEDAGRTD